MLQCNTTHFFVTANTHLKITNHRTKTDLKLCSKRVDTLLIQLNSTSIFIWRSKRPTITKTNTKTTDKKTKIIDSKKKKKNSHPNKLNVSQPDIFFKGSRGLHWTSDPLIQWSIETPFAENLLIKPPTQSIN